VLPTQEFVANGGGRPSGRRGQSAASPARTGSRGRVGRRGSWRSIAEFAEPSVTPQGASPSGRLQQRHRCVAKPLVLDGNAGRRMGSPANMHGFVHSGRLAVPRECRLRTTAGLRRLRGLHRPRPASRCGLTRRDPAPLRMAAPNRERQRTADSEEARHPIDQLVKELVYDVPRIADHMTDRRSQRRRDGRQYQESRHGERQEGMCGWVPGDLGQ